MIGIVFAYSRNSKTPKTSQERTGRIRGEIHSKRKYKQKPAKQKPAEKKETSAFCENCGKPLKPRQSFVANVVHPAFVITIIEKSQITIIGINKG